jgi:hypothetical protein
MGSKEERSQPRFFKGQPFFFAGFAAIERRMASPCENSTWMPAHLDAGTLEHR